MTVRARALISLLLLALAATALGACGSEDPEEASEITGDTLSVYSSLPRPLEQPARDIVRAQKLAIQEAGGRAGAFNVSYVSLDAADPSTGRTTPGRVAANAREAIRDRQTIAYLGELEWGASAVSVPILNEAGILQVSPWDTLGGLTEPGGRGEPDRFYPSGVRTFGRVVPSDAAQAAALSALARRRGARRVVLAGDGGAAARALADRLRRTLSRAGVDVVESADAADAAVWAGPVDRGSAGALRAILRRAPGGRVFAAELVVPGDARTRDFARRFAAEYGRPPHPRAVLGYAAMRAVLDAVDRAGDRGGRRRVVIREALRTLGAPRARFNAMQVDAGDLRRLR